METTEPEAGGNSNTDSVNLGQDQTVPHSGKLDPEVKAAWVAALRSGDYTQGREYLRSSDDTFCCLGVLCELAVDAGVTRRRKFGAWQYGGMTDALGFEEGFFAGYPPASVRRWAGFPRRADFEGLAHSPKVKVPEAWLPLKEDDHEHLRNEVEADGTARLGLPIINDRARLTFEQIAQLIEEQL
jgi:hypothetical protein